MNVCSDLEFRSRKIIGVDGHTEYCSWQEVVSLSRLLAEKIKSEGNKYDVIMGVTNGGIIPARLMARELSISHIQLMPIRNNNLHEQEMPLLFQEKKYLIVDEIYDTGGTFSKIYNAVRLFSCDFAVLISRCKDVNIEDLYVGKILNHNKWVIFPWE